MFAEDQSLGCNLKQASLGELVTPLPKVLICGCGGDCRGSEDRSLEVVTVVEAVAL